VAVAITRAVPDTVVSTRHARALPLLPSPRLTPPSFRLTAVTGGGSPLGTFLSPGGGTWNRSNAKDAVPHHTLKGEAPWHLATGGADHRTAAGLIGATAHGQRYARAYGTRRASMGAGIRSSACPSTDSGAGSGGHRNTSATACDGVS